MNDLPTELQRLILNKVSNDADRASIRAVSKELKHIIDENSPITDQSRYTSIHALGMDKTLSLFLRRSVAAHRKKKLMKQMKTWLSEDKVTFKHHVHVFVNKLHVRKDRKLLFALHGQEEKGFESKSVEAKKLLKAVRQYVDSRIEVHLQE